MFYFTEEREQQFTNRFGDIFMDPYTGQFKKSASPASVLEWFKEVLDYELGYRKTTQLRSVNPALNRYISQGQYSKLKKGSIIKSIDGNVRREIVWRDGIWITLLKLNGRKCKTPNYIQYPYGYISRNYKILKY